jgi:hypothetical protein
VFPKPLVDHLAGLQRIRKFAHSESSSLEEFVQDEEEEEKTDPFNAAKKGKTYGMELGTIHSISLVAVLSHFSSWPYADQ